MIRKSRERPSGLSIRGPGRTAATPYISSQGSDRIQMHGMYRTGTACDLARWVEGRGRLLYPRHQKPLGRLQRPPSCPRRRAGICAGVARAAGKGVARAFAGLNVYLTLRDAAQAAGIAQPDYETIEAPYYFTANDGSVYTVQEGGWFTDYKRNFVAGPRAGQSETISKDQYEGYAKEGEATWGKLIDGGLFSEPRFIPGTKRSSLPIMDEQGRNIGYIDEKGVHRYAPSMIGPPVG